ncbi:MAG: hypothetical protein KGY56_01730 [Desulfobacterales bacterium]|nr:hypothetical protein [Desulfobacterales bacterium]
MAPLRGFSLQKSFLPDPTRIPALFFSNTLVFLQNLPILVSMEPIENKDFTGKTRE